MKNKFLIFFILYLPRYNICFILTDKIKLVFKTFFDK